MKRERMKLPERTCMVARAGPTRRDGMEPWGGVSQRPHILKWPKLLKRSFYNFYLSATEACKVISQELGEGLEQDHNEKDGTVGEGTVD